MNPGFLIGAGFLLGSVGLKAATSEKAKQLYVKGIVQGMRAKEEVETVIDEARAEFDDLLAEAGYVKELEEGEEAASVENAEGSDVEETDSASQPEKKAKAKKAAADDAVKQVAKAVSVAAKTATGKGAGKGGHGHGHGRGGK